MTVESKHVIVASRLKPSSKSILYALATIAGEPERLSDFKITQENARLWNGYWTYNWSTSQRKEFNEKQEGNALAHLLKPHDIKRINNVLDERGFKDVARPSPSDSIDFQYTEFSKPVYFTDFLFVRSPEFNDAKFTKHVDFQGATFDGYANFGNAEFMGITEFNRANFMEYADFGKATFHKRIFFKGVTFKTSMDFAEAEFKTHPPAFYDAKMSENIIWTRVKLPSVQRLNARIAEEHKDAYERLALMMSKLEKDHDRHLFFRKEMQVRRQIDKNWTAGLANELKQNSKLITFFKHRIKWVDSRVSMLINFMYEIFSNYGYGFGRAFSWWSLNLTIGALILFPYKNFKLATPNIESLGTAFTLWGKSLSLSFSNAHSFLGLSKRGMENVYTEFQEYHLIAPFDLT